VVDEFESKVKAVASDILSKFVNSEGASVNGALFITAIETIDKTLMEKFTQMFTSLSVCFLWRDCIFLI